MSYGTPSRAIPTVQGHDFPQPSTPDTTAEQPAGAAPNERRGADRYRTVWRVAKVERDGDAGLWRIRNMSNHGMMLEADVAIGVGEKLKIALSESVSVSGRVVWAEHGRCGVAFDAAVNVADILKRLAMEQRATGYRQPRLEVRMRAMAGADGQMNPIDLVDLSQNGAGFSQGGPFEVGKEVDLVMPGGLRRRAIVRWAKGTRGGLWLTQPLDRAELESVQRFQSGTDSQA